MKALVLFGVFMGVLPNLSSQEWIFERSLILPEAYILNHIITNQTYSETFIASKEMSAYFKGKADAYQELWDEMNGLVPLPVEPK